MPRPKNKVPSYLPHKRSGQARVRIKMGSRYQDISLGPYGSRSVVGGNISSSREGRLLAGYCSPPAAQLRYPMLEKA